MNVQSRGFTEDSNHLIAEDRAGAQTRRGQRRVRRIRSVVSHSDDRRRRDQRLRAAFV